MTDLHLNIDGPHSDDYTREVVRGLAECVRVLNHATYPGCGVTYPSTVYDVLGSLHATVAGLDQLLRQLDARLVELRDTGRLRDSRDIDPATTITHARQALVDARSLIPTLAHRLGRAHNATAALGLRVPVRGGPELDKATEAEFRDGRADYDLGEGEL